jgi:undecaprenyl-diphosphatase
LGYIGSIDASISVFINSFAQRWYLLDRLVNFANGNMMVRGTLVFTLFYFVWFQSKGAKSDNELTDNRLTLLYILLVSVPALFVVRIMAWVMPYRPRPINIPDLHIRVAYGFEYLNLLQWSSFPSDTIFLYMLLATGVFLVNRKIGILLYLHAFFFVGMTRIYLGIHYPSDVLVGALLGCATGFTANLSFVRSGLNRLAVYLRQVPVPLLYAGLFFLCIETANEYISERTAAAGALQIARVLVKHLSNAHTASNLR